MLLRLLEETRALAAAGEVLDCLDAAIEFVRPADGGGYGRGSQLVGFLRHGGRAAVAHREMVVAERLADFAEHAAGRLPLSILEAFYVPAANGFLVEEVAVGLALPRVAHDHLTYLGRVEGLFKELPAEAVEALSWPYAEALAHLIEVRSRRRALSELREVVGDPGSSERDILRCLGGDYWMFGGAHVRELDVRGFLDVPLLRGDGVLHVVRFERANEPGLLGRHGSQIRLGASVHRGVSRVESYLRALDQDRDRIRDVYGVDSGRVAGTVVIGHSRHLGSAFSEQELAEAVRAHNGGSRRVEVITYDTLIESAERALTLAPGPA